MDRIAEFKKWRNYIANQVRRCKVFPNLCDIKSPLRINTELAKKVHEAKLDKDFELSLNHED